MTIPACALSLLQFFAPHLGQRQALDQAELMQAQERVEFVDNKYFMKVGREQLQPLEFNGAIEVSAFTLRAEPPSIDDLHFLPGDPAIFPGGRFEFFTYKDHLVPAQRDFLDLAGPHFWRIALQPGRIWKESRDKGFSRAMFPFILAHPFDGPSLNGLATFLYNGERVSQLRVQILQQTLPTLIRQRDAKGNMVDSLFTAVGQGAIADYEPDLESTPTGRLKADYQRELNAQWPVKGIYRLGDFLKESRLKEFVKLVEGFDSIGKRRYNVASALVVDHTIYRKGCNTPYGPLPLCDTTLFGVQSVSKTIIGSLTLGYFMQKYGPEIPDNFISELLPEVEQLQDPIARELWKAVRVRHVWNMASGFGYGVEQSGQHDMYVGYDFLNNEKDVEFIRGTFMEDKLKAALEVPPLRFENGRLVGSGSAFSRYREQEPVLLGIYLQRFLEKQDHAQSDLGELIREQILKPIGVWHIPLSRFLKRRGGSQLALGYTSYLSLDAIAKITTLIKNRGYHPRAGQLLHPEAFKDVLPRQDRSGDGQGWMIETRPGVQDEVSYSKFFHLWPYRNGDGCFYQYPQMQGHGGDKVDIFPNGMIGIRIAKNNDYEEDTSWWNLDPMADLANFLNPFCSKH